VSVAAGAMVAPLRQSFLAGYQGLSVPSYVADSAVDSIQSLAAELEAVRAGNPVDAAAAPLIIAAIQALSDDAAELARVGSVGDRLTATSAITRTDVAIEAPIVDRVAGVIADLRAAMEPETALQALAPIAAFGLEGPAFPAITPSRRREAKNLATIAMLAQVAALTQMCAAIADMDFTDRRAAIQVRADIAEAIDAELDILIGPDAYPAALALLDLRGRTVEYLSRAIADLAPVVAVSALVTMPSLWWANRLYGDAGRATELVAKNRVKHPSFMPLEFEALVQ